MYRRFLFRVDRSKITNYVRAYYYVKVMRIQIMSLGKYNAMYVVITKYRAEQKSHQLSQEISQMHQLMS